MNRSKLIIITNLIFANEKISSAKIQKIKTEIHCEFLILQDKYRYLARIIRIVAGITAF